METIRNQLLADKLTYEMYGSASDCREAKEAFDRVVGFAHDAARNHGESFILFAGDILPRKAIRKFRSLCESQDLKFQEIKIEQSYQYKVSWDW